MATLSATVGSSPYRLAEGDFNGDGILDLAVANYGSNTVSILIGNGDGTYHPQTTYSVNSLPFGIAVGDVNGDGKLDLVVGHDGGGISNTGTLKLSQVTVTNNTAPQNGGGIYNTNTLFLFSSTVSGNMAQGNGGAIAKTLSLTLENSTVSGNTAVGNGGAIDNSESLGVFQSTISGNTAVDGAGIENESSGTTQVVQSTVSANTSTGQTGATASNLNNTGTPVTITNSVIAGNTAAGGDCANCGQQNASNLFGTAAATLSLGPLANSGGPTQTMVPLTGSPVIGLGNVSLALDYANQALTTDQRLIGYARIVNGRVDLGAVQSNSGIPSTLGLAMASSFVAGTAQNVTVSVLTPSGNPAATYTNTVHFTSSDLDAQLPADYTFAPADGGTHTFSIALETAGSQSVAVADTVVPYLHVSQTVNVGFGAGFAVTAVSGSGQSAKVGAAFSTALSARATDAYGNTVSGATVVFTAPGSGASGSFSGGGTSASAQTNTSGIATSPTFTANNTTGQYSVTASVQGVQSSATFALTNAVKPDYSVTVNPSTLSVQAGQSGRAVFTITPVDGYSGTLQLSCNGLPTGAICLFQPAQALLDGSNAALTVQLTVDTTGGNGLLSSMQPVTPPGIPSGFTLASFSVPSGFIVLLLLERRRPRPASLRYCQGILILAVGCAIGMGLAGCRSTKAPAPSPATTPSGQYSVNVAAVVSSGSNSHATSLTITITQ